MALIGARRAVALGPRPFSPSDLAGLKLWLDASRIAGLADGNPVTQWDDLSGNGNHVTQATAANQPTYRATIENGRAAVRFDGGDYLQAASQAAFDLATYTIIAVAKVSGRLCGKSTTAFADGRRRKLQVENLDTAAVVVNGADAGNFAQHSYSVPTRDIVIYRWVQRSDAALDIAVNGVNEVKTQTTQASTFNDALFSVGCNFETGLETLTGDVQLLLVYDRALTVEQCTRLEREYIRPRYFVRRGHSTYLLATFVGNSDQCLALHTSTDRTTWSKQHANYLIPNGKLRDPSLLKRNGRYWVAHTKDAVGVATTSFGVAYSDDVLDWTHHVDVSMTAIVGVNRVWAPEWFVDPADDSVYVFVSCSTDGSTFALYETHPTNAAMTTWSAPVAISGTGLPSNMIDPFVVKRGATYYLWFKNEAAGAKKLGYLQSSSLTSGYTVVQDGTTDWAGWGSDVEGPSLLSLGGNSWRMYLDKYSGGSEGLYYSDSADNWATWGAKALISAEMRHGTVIVA